MTNFPSIPKRIYEDVRAEIRSGDLLLASGEYPFSKLIQKTPDSPWSHVAFVMRLDVIDRVMVLESIETKVVRTIPLSEYVRNFEGTGRGYRGRLAIARHRLFQEKCDAAALQRMAQFAVDRFSYPYDEDEIARITLRLVGAALGFKKRELKRGEEFICSEYVYECYQRIGIQIRYDSSGFVAPKDFANDPVVDLLWEIEVIRR